jgi:exosortase
MNPLVADRKLAWVLPAAVSVIVVAAMLLFPYASGYGLGSDPLWRLLLTLWNASDEWKHGMFVFPIAAVLIFLKRTELAKVPIKGSNWGLLLIVPSLFLYWVGFVANVQYIGYLAIQLMLGGCVVWFLGVRFFKAVFFIWCFLFFAYPFIFLEDLVAFPLRLLMSEASVRFLNLIGFHSIRDGTAIISAADPVAGIVSGQRYSVDVADPCSGIRSLFALTMISALVGILSFRKGWKVMILFAAALPLAVFGNFCRILMLTFGTVAFGSDIAVGTLENPTWFHLAAGFVVYIAALIGIFLFARLLKGQFGIKRRQLK